MNATEIVDREFLNLRARLLDLAAGLDRIDRAGATDEDHRRTLLNGAVELLLETAPDRTERIQRLLSRPYEEDWRELLDLRRNVS